VSPVLSPIGPRIGADDPATCTPHAARRLGGTALRWVARRPIETAGCAGLASALSLRRQANRPPRAARRRGRDGLKLIYTIGYQRLTSRRLEKIVGDLDAILVDCRYRPFSQRPEFSGDRLAEQFGARYQQRGHELGGHGHTTVDGIDRLRLDAERATLILLCMEEAPGDCHRHHAICGPHFPAAVHIFRDEQFTAKTLQDALDAGDVARLYGETADLFR
jgi:hypothetical protein